MSIKQFGFTIKSDDEVLSRDHTTGQVTHFEKWELRKVLTKLAQLHPESPAQMMLDTLQSYYFEEDNTEDSASNRTIAPFFPFLLQYFRGKKLNRVETVLLWVVACYWYNRCGGPYPISATKKPAVVKPPKWQAELRCPICNGFPPKSKVNSKDEQVLLTQFGQWMIGHAKLCQKKLTRKQAEEANKRRLEAEARRNSEYERIRRQYYEAKEMEPEIRRELMRGWKKIDDMHREADRIRILQQQQDEQDFANGVKKAMVSIAKGLEPLSVEDVFEYSSLIKQIARIEELLGKIKGQKGYSKERAALNKDLAVRKAKLATLEERRLVAGEN